MGNQPAVVKKAVGSIGSGRILCLAPLSLWGGA